MSIPQTFIQELLSRIDVVEVVGRYVPLRKAGANFMGLCPFHGEKSPSFSVSPSKQFFHCFGCGKSGNAIGFLMEHAGMGFVDAVEDLARQVGLTVPDDHATAADKERAAAARQHQATLSEVLEKAAQDYRKQLRQSSKAIDYLKGRGVSGEVAQRYGLGYAPEGWRHLASVFPQYDEPLLAESGLVIVGEEDGKRYDRFRDRVMFPIRSVKGECIGFGGRVLGDDKPKYLNSPETPVFHKGQELYGLYEARQHHRDLDEVMVVEGYMDVIALAQQGLRNAVATLGTATSEEHIKRLFRLVPNILFCFDGDQAGRKAAWRALEACLPSLQDGRRVRFLFLPEGEDPDSLVRQEGAEAFRARISQQAQPLAEYFFRHLMEEADPATLEGKAHLATLAAPLLDKLPGANLRALMRQRLGEITGLSGESLGALAGSPTNDVPPADFAPSYDPDSHTGYPAYPDERSDWQAGQGQGKRKWQDGGDWKGKKNGQRREPPAVMPPRGGAGVEPPTLSALRTLLHHPQLAQKVEDAGHFAAEDDTYTQLLVALLESLQKHPQQNSLQLIARWHGTEQGRLLRGLAEKEWLIQQDNLEQQFFDTITTLATRQRERSLEGLLRKARHSELSAEEKLRLRELLSRSEAPASPGPSGA